jgi:hypothetical protein
MVSAMLPDLRFVLGATLAVAMLAVAGLGVVASVELAQRARMASLEPTQTLAYSGHAEWNQFYDPDNARRFVEAAGKSDQPVGEAPVEAPAESAAPALPAAPAEQSTAAPADRIEAVAAGEKTAAADPPRAAETPMIGTPAPPADATAPAASAPEVPEPTGNREPTAEPVRVVTAPAASPGADAHVQNKMPAQPQVAVDPRKDPTVHAPRPRLKVRPRAKFARAHVTRTVPPEQPTFQNSFPAPNTQSPGYGNNQWPAYGSNQLPSYGSNQPGAAQLTNAAGSKKPGASPWR